MPYLDQYTTSLTAQTAAHLLRRATFGPRPEEIASFTNLSANAAVDLLISNCVYDLPQPVILDQNSDIRGQPFVFGNADLSSTPNFIRYEEQWWIGQMANQSAPPSILEKLTLFWQNHFVTNAIVVNEYRMEYKYLKLCRDYALGNFKSFVINMSTDPAMLTYLNGNENVTGAPNENYARELQELFMMGAKNYNGDANYTENDVKEAARVLTGWKDFRFDLNNSYATYDPIKHDTGNKTFSQIYYNNTIINGQGGSNGGNIELAALINMMANHPETAKFICRKLYRWFVHTEVTQNIETNIIIPLANLFKTSNFEILPVIKKLLKSEHFYEAANIGSMVKSPCDLLIGTLRFFNLPVPATSTSDVDSFHKYTVFIKDNLEKLQMTILEQPSVFGYEPYYQTGLSRIWINSTSLAQRSYFTDTLVNGTYMVNANYFLKINLLQRANQAMTVAPYDPFLIVENFTKNLFATGLNTDQKNFLTDTIMMGGFSRANWNVYWNAYINDPTNPTRQAEVIPRLNNLMTYLLRMAEYQVF